MGASLSRAQPPAPSFRSRVDGTAVQVPVAAGLTGGTEWDLDSIDTDVAEDDLSLPVDTLLGQRQLALDHLIDSNWTLEEGDKAEQAPSCLPIQEVRIPTASRINYRSLHPAVYRYMEPFSKLEQVARLLRVARWRAEADRIWPAVRDAFNEFVALPSTAPETDVQGMLLRLILDMAHHLNRDCHPRIRQCARVRGTLARDHLVVRGVVDLVFYSHGLPILAAQVKTAQSWRLLEAWYIQSRGAQLFQTLYAANCPTLLVSQEQFRLFWENDDRTHVATYPCGPTGENADDADEFNATLRTGSTWNMLYPLLVVCLLRATRRVPAVAHQTDWPHLENTDPNDNVTAATKSTPKKRARANRASATDRRTRSAKRVRGRAAPLPTFFTGMYDASGEPIFQTVHAELVEQFEPDSSDSDDASSSCGKLGSLWPSCNIKQSVY